MEENEKNKNQQIERKKQQIKDQNETILKLVDTSVGHFLR